MAYKIRQLAPGDAAAAYRLGSIAFGYADRPMPPPPPQPPVGRRSWGAFTTDDVLVGKAIDIEQSQWFGGRLVPSTGVAGVAVAAEHRGHGVSTTLMTELMAGARERGAVIGALFDTTPWPYRRVGWEEIGVRQTLALPTVQLAGIRSPDGYAVRGAVATDVPAILDAFRQVAQANCGIVDRGAPGADVTPAAVLAEHHGTTVAVDADGVIQGYCAWDRGGSYRADGTLTVWDLIALTPQALTALLAMIGSWAGVAPKLLINLAAQDPALLVSAMSGASVHSRDPWMLRVIDVAAAVEARGWPSYVTGSVDLNIADASCPWNSGAYRLTLDAGTGRLEPGGTGAVALGPRGLALLYAGAAAPDAMRRAGLLVGGDASTDAFLQVATSGPAPTLHDYF